MNSDGRDFACSAAYCGTLADARRLIDTNRLVPRAEAGFRGVFGRPPGAEEVSTWHEALPTVLAAASEAVPDNTHLLLEYRLPFNDQRIDALLVGNHDGQPRAHVIELKNWSACNVSYLDHFVMVNGVPAVHPSYQVLAYAGKLRNFHSYGPQLGITQSVLLSDSKRASHGALFRDVFAPLIAEAPIAFTSDELALAMRRSAIDTGSADTVRDLCNGSYSQSHLLLEELKLKQEAILSRANAALAVSGWGLTAVQLRVLDEIMAAIRTGRRAVFLVEGVPGSGKTLLGLHVLLQAAGMQKSTVLAMRSNRLVPAVRQILREEILGGNGFVKYFSTSGGAGVEDGSSQIADVLVCDEAQRLRLATPNVLQRAPVVVMLYDQRQALNEVDARIARRLTSACDEIGVAPEQFDLPTPYRSRGGGTYLAWVDEFLSTPESAVRKQDIWPAAYELQVADAPDALIRALREKGLQKRVGLLASWTRASGKAQPVSEHDLGKMRVAETRPPIYWLMDPASEYVPFFVDGRSNDLTQCASVVGCQGFELDYAGLFWGDDLVIRNGKWEVGNPNNCYDRTGGDVGARLLPTLMRSDKATAATLLRNRYRIFLTRGVFGTICYSEDPETQDFFLRYLRRLA